MGERGGNHFFFILFQVYALRCLLERCNLLENDDPVIWSTRIPAELVEPGDFHRENDFLNNRVIIRTGHPEMSRPARFRTPSLKSLEPLRPTMAWMDLMELHKLQQQQWLLLLEGLFQIEMNGQWKREKRRDQTILETMDSSCSTKMENKWANDIPTQRNAQRHRLTANYTRKTQIYAYSNAENMLLSIECTHVDKGCSHW